MVIPDFLLRRLYVRGSLRETGNGRFAFRLRNTLGDATLLAPPRVDVNGIRYRPEQVVSRTVNVAAISAVNPHRFAKGDRVTLRLPGHLLRGGNRIHIRAKTLEYGDLEIFVEDNEATFCEIPGADSEE